ncbi:hypothetical protein MW887_003638 [Aspergillus wentii]|nr:hypothetical protein MW887_003638 [Aspergillus wentii]
MDEVVAPNLAGVAVEMQQKEVFCLFVAAAFPSLFSAYSARVEINWVDFVRYHMRSAPDALVWAVRSITTLYAGKHYKDQGKVIASRHMYSFALRNLTHLLRNAKFNKADGPLAAATLLGLYEIVDGTGQHSWLTHTGGISTLFRLRGASAHRTGFGRTILVSFRSFLVADAFTRGEPSFLAQEEWRSIFLDGITADRKRGKGTELGDLVEYAFNEITLCPGLLARTNTIIAAEDVLSSERSTLLHEITSTLENLTNLHSQLTVRFLENSEKSMAKRSDIIGPIPVKVVGDFAKFSLQGMQMAISLLHQLQLLIKADSVRRLHDSQTTDPWRNMNVPTAAELLQGDIQAKDIVPSPSDQEGSLKWLDQIGLSMGMLAIKT